MKHRSITLSVPDYIYDRARQIAEGTSKSIEAVLLQQLTQAFPTPLPDLPADEQRELEALALLSDAALWTIAREHMPQDRQARLHILMAVNSQRAIDEGQRRNTRGAGAAVERLEGLSVGTADRTGLYGDSGSTLRDQATTLAKVSVGPDCWATTPRQLLSTATSHPGSPAD